MIPKIIHYCWLSDDPYPEKINKCIASWKKYLPDYEVVKWDFNRIDKSKFKWISDAFDNKRYAFAADYVRVYALYHYGGIYLDSDVEVLRSFDELLNMPYLFCNEFKSDRIEAACMGAEPFLPVFKKMIDYYNSRNFVKEDGTFDEITIPTLLREMIKADYDIVKIGSPSGIIKNSSLIYVLPFDFFSPKSLINGRIYKTDNTYAIHHFAGNWMPSYFRWEQKFWHKLGVRDLRILLRIHNLFKFGTLRSKPQSVN